MQMKSMKIPLDLGVGMNERKRNCYLLASKWQWVKSQGNGKGLYLHFVDKTVNTPFL